MKAKYTGSGVYTEFVFSESRKKPFRVSPGLGIPDFVYPGSGIYHFVYAPDPRHTRIRITGSGIHHFVYTPDPGYRIWYTPESNHNIQHDAAKRGVYRIPYTPESNINIVHDEAKSGGKVRGIHKFRYTPDPAPPTPEQKSTPYIRAPHSKPGPPFLGPPNKTATLHRDSRAIHSA